MIHNFPHTFTTEESGIEVQVYKITDTHYKLKVHDRTFFYQFDGRDPGDGAATNASTNATSQDEQEALNEFLFQLFY